MGALHRAVANGHDEAVKLLIGRGACMHIKDDGDNRTPLDDAKEWNKFSTAAIIEAAMKSTKAIYASSNELQQNTVTFKDFNNNIIILSDNDIPNGLEFEGHPIITLRHLRQCVDQLLLPTSNDEDNTHQDAIHDVLVQRHPVIARRLQYWSMNPL